MVVPSGLVQAEEIQRCRDSPDSSAPSNTELQLQQLVEYDQRKYGSTVLCFYALRSVMDEV